jgi:hypothetical protein
VKGKAKVIRQPDGQRKCVCIERKSTVSGREGITICSGDGKILCAGVSTELGLAAPFSFLILGKNEVSRGTQAGKARILFKQKSRIKIALNFENKPT